MVSLILELMILVIILKSVSTLVKQSVFTAKYSSTSVDILQHTDTMIRR